MYSVVKKLKKNRALLIAVTGGIASYKVCEVVRILLEKGVDVRVIMTENASRFVSPLTFSALTSNPVLVEEFPQESLKEVWSPMAHIELARWADVLLIAPATANTIAKIAHGIADNLVTSTVLGFRGKVVFCPAMNSAMWENPVTQENIKKLKEHGYIEVEPGFGFLACGEIGPGRLAEPEKIAQIVMNTFNSLDGPFSGVRAIVTGGSTREYIDPVRFITNASTGTLALACADVLYQGGAEVELIAGQGVSESELEKRGYKVSRVVSARDMLEAVLEKCEACDILFMFGAVSDYTVAIHPEKIRKDERTSLTIKLRRTEDVLQAIKDRKKPLVKIGVSIDTRDVEAVARQKLREKKLDAIVAVSYAATEQPYGKSPLSASVLTSNGVAVKFGKYEKDYMAERVAYLALEMLEQKRRRKRVENS